MMYFSTGRYLQRALQSARHVVDPMKPFTQLSYTNPSCPSLHLRRNYTTEKVSLTFVDAEGHSKVVTASTGETLLDVAHENDIELEGACGGELACSTCHLIFEKNIYEELPSISEEEEDMLDLAWGLTETSRLGCQIKVTKAMEGTTVRIPEDSNNLL